MIKLKEIYNMIRDSNKEGLVETDSWKLSDVDHLTDIGFTLDGIYHMRLRNPELKLCYKKGEGFILEDKRKKEKRIFKDSNELFEYFEKYEQQWQSTPYL